MPKFKWETEFKEMEIGEIPRIWDEKPYNEVVAKPIKDGGTPSRKRNDIYFGGNIPWVTIKDISRLIYDTNEHLTEEGLKHSSAKLWPKETIIFSFGATIGEVGIAKVELATKQSICGIYIDEKKGVNFYYYYLLKLLKEYFEDLAGGTTFGEIRPPVIEKIHLPYPSLEEQSRIATVLSWFDDLIENKKRQNEILEKTAMAIFKSWFVDFEPFKDGEFVDSELGKIPEGWEVKPIGEVAEIRNGMSYSGREKFEEPVEGSYVFITLNNAIEGGGFKPVYAWIKSDRIKEHHFLEEGDLIIPNTEQTKDERLLGSPGIVFFPPDYEDKGIYSHHITRISPFDKKHKSFLYLLLKFTREDSASFATGTGVLGMDINNFKRNKLVIVPPKPILEKFHSLVEPLGCTPHYSKKYLSTKNKSWS